jgi:ubiquinone/menaquinone biosynthesis C-methylase UbiE
MITIGNERDAAEAFSRQSVIFDDIYAGNTIVHYKRERVRSHFMRYANPHGNILELNSGTGQDAIFFASQGFTVHATDVSAGMQEQLRHKAQLLINGEKITTELCSFTQLHLLEKQGPYDAIFSNLGGLNCTAELDKVLQSFRSLLKPDGTVTLVIISKFCLWELLLLFKGKFKTATRRLFAGKGRTAHIEGQYFKCWYYSPSYVVGHLQKDFDLLAVEGLCTIVPPSYMEGFAEKHPAIYNRLKKWENRLKSVAPFKYWGDYFIISLKKK